MLRLAAFAVLLGLAAYLVRALLRKERRLGTLAVVLVLAGYVTWPPSFLVLDAECRPDDIVYRASAGIHGQRFWREQLRAVRSELAAASSSDATRKDWLQNCEHAARVRSEQGGAG